MTNDTPQQIASGLFIDDALRAVRSLRWDWLPDQTFDWRRLHASIMATDEVWRHLILSASAAPVGKARVSILFPAGVVPLHADSGEQLHVVLMSNPHADFSFPPDRPFHMPVGTAWVLPTQRPHTAYNGGTTPRIHLVCPLR